MYFLKVGTLEYQININMEIVFFYKLINLFGSGISKMFQKVNHHCLTLDKPSKKQRYLHKLACIWDCKVF